MLAQYKTNTNLGIGFGIVAAIIGSALRPSPIGLVILLLGYALFIWGCVQYAKGKGHSGWLGALGILSILGLIVLALLPDRHK